MNDSGSDKKVAPASLIIETVAFAANSSTKYRELIISY
jgi:hypothetical protein